MVERKNGQKAFLRLFNDMEKFPSEAEVGVTFKRFVMELPKVGFLTGHGEPSITGALRRDYLLFAGEKTFRHSLLNQGFDTEEVSISGEADIPNYINILVVADMNKPLTEEETVKLNKYIERGKFIDRSRGR
ncbi:MAG: Gldg family protein [Butyricimonas faecihominis]